MPASSPQASENNVPSVDGVTRAAPTSKASSPSGDINKTKRALLLGAGIVYGLLTLWFLSLLVLLPSPTGSLKGLVAAGSLSALLCIVLLFLVGAFMLQRIAKANVSTATRRRSLIKLILPLLPLLILSGVTPFLIMREPSLGLAITYPTRAEDFVAPLSVTFSAEHATDVLKKRGLRPILYVWDFDGDGKPNEETVLPVATAVYERQGAFVPAVRINLDDGTFRRVTRRLTIPRAVFSVSPLRPVVEKPVRFSIAHLVAKPEDIREARWDFEGDGVVDEVTKNTDVQHTYYAVERVPVSVVVLLVNQSQVTYERDVDIEQPRQLPFPVTLITEPKNLVGPAPFGAIFRIDTQEPLREVVWSFGDGQEERGADLRRIGHSFASPKIYPVSVKVRSASGSLAELTQLVRVTETLSIGDLRFDGTPKVEGAVIRGEVPVTLDLKAVTSLPLVEFLWEAPNATTFHATGAALRAIYRTEGSYTLTLVAQDPEGKVMRKTLTVEVSPASAAPTISMQPSAGVAPLKVLFDASESFIPPGEEVAGFEWSFGDEVAGAGAELGSARIEHIYEKPGEYIIRLRVVMESGSEYTAERTIVVRKPLLDACIQTSRPLTVRAGEGIRFDPLCSTGSPVSFLWDIRDASRPSVVLAQSAEQSYPHVFEEAGTYTVTLTVKDALANENKETITITVENP
ncbi:hypothetical protein A3D88_02880 [Candidatus Peribacteria bacterium RIFCSPHIGHO2_02_FULL_52_16]|nr:MAG: hypothetical protein A2706_00710 [Candidatus Peribacteria bacterium RIFCSPHIGHO2_01_FULL_51_35]OGJ61702.1 MAG: hypothetical protein A3D88_02880 [Candidatus Peribacteria bacterium RIFCSPHIGHO2_02_FULL_52_16]